MKIKLLLIMVALSAAVALTVSCSPNAKNTIVETKPRVFGDTGYIFKGVMDQYSDIFIFEDKDGNEVDLYLKPKHRHSKWFKGTPIEVGNSYNIKFKKVKMYAGPIEQSQEASLNFKWGTVPLQKHAYYIMYTSKELVNIRGRIYYKSGKRTEHRY